MKEQQALAELFMPIKLVPKQFDALVEQRSRRAGAACAPRNAPSCSCAYVTRACRAPTSSSCSPATKSTIDWAAGLAKGKAKYAEAIGNLQADIQRCQQKLADHARPTPA